MVAEVKIDPFVFRWPVNESGYIWTEALDSKLRLAPVDTPGGRTELKEPPPGLFRDFSDLAPTQNTILGFAKTHGDLFRTISFANAREKRAIMVGTSLERWKIEIADMHTLVELWGHITERHIKELRKVITWDGKSGVRYSIKTPKRERLKWLALQDSPEDNLDPFVTGDVVLPAKYALHYEINARLADPESRAVPQLAWTPDNHQRLIFRPSDLLAAMWLQFAKAVTGEYQLKKCAACANYFQVGPGARRADATTCSDACRQRKRRSTGGKS
jgi:hypothetical protein